MNSQRLIMRTDDLDFQANEIVRVLAIGAIDHCGVIYDALRKIPHLQLKITADYRELWEIPSEAIHIFILQNTLSGQELEEAGQRIRHQWPRAKILVVRDGDDFLDDPLYDDRVLPSVLPGALLIAVEHLLWTCPDEFRRDGGQKLN